MCGRLHTECPNRATCEASGHAVTVRQGATMLSGVVTQSSSHGACVELTADCDLVLGSWVVLSDAHRLRSGCDARIVGIEGRTCRIAFDPGFVTAMAHFGHLDARRAAHRDKEIAGTAQELAVSL